RLGILVLRKIHYVRGESVRFRKLFHVYLINQRVIKTYYPKSGGIHLDIQLISALCLDDNRQCLRHYALREGGKQESYAIRKLVHCCHQPLRVPSPYGSDGMKVVFPERKQIAQTTTPLELHAHAIADRPVQQEDASLTKWEHFV